MHIGWGVVDIMVHGEHDIGQNFLKLEQTGQNVENYSYGDEKQNLGPVFLLALPEGHGDQQVGEVPKINEHEQAQSGTDAHEN